MRGHSYSTTCSLLNWQRDALIRELELCRSRVGVLLESWSQVGGELESCWRRVGVLLVVGTATEVGVFKKAESVSFAPFVEISTAD